MRKRCEQLPSCNFSLLSGVREAEVRELGTSYLAPVGMGRALKPIPQEKTDDCGEGARGKASSLPYVLVQDVSDRNQLRLYRSASGIISQGSGTAIAAE